MSEEDFTEGELEPEEKFKSQRANVHRIMLPAALDIGIVKFQAQAESGKSSAILWLLNEQLAQLGLIDAEAHRLLAERYSRRLVDVVAERAAKRENGNVSVLTLEKQKELEKLADKDKYFKEVLKQWDFQRPISWREKVVALAEKWADKLESARLILEKKNEMLKELGKQ